MIYILGAPPLLRLDEGVDRYLQRPALARLVDLLHLLSPADEALGRLEGRWPRLLGLRVIALPLHLVRPARRTAGLVALLRTRARPLLRLPLLPRAG